MTDRERPRAFARGLRIALAVGWTCLPLGAAAGQPDHGRAGFAVPGGAGEDVPRPPLPTPLSHIHQPFGRSEPFGLPEGDWPAGYAAKWRAMTFVLDRDRNALAECRRWPDRCSSAARRLIELADTARDKQGRARLGEVNRAINLAIRYQSDIAQHGATDAWASPLATLSSGRGDCEDYAIAKYLALNEAGVPPGDLRLVVVRDTRLGRDHAVLAARLEDRWLVLDNRRLPLVEDRDARDYAAVAVFGPNAGSLQVMADGHKAQERAPAVAADATRPEPDPS